MYRRTENSWTEPASHSSGEMREDCLRSLIASPALREAAGKVARTRIEEHYQWQQIAEEIESAYFEVLGWKPNPSAARKENKRAEGVLKDELTHLRTG